MEPSRCDDDRTPQSDHTTAEVLAVTQAAAGEMTAVSGMPGEAGDVRVDAREDEEEEYLVEVRGEAVDPEEKD